MNEAIATPWRRASLAVTLFLLDPLGLGLRLRASPGPARDALTAALAEALAPMKLTRIPAQIADDRLLGGLDVAATLRAGRLVAETGVLASADGGVVAVAMAERMSAATAARFAGALDHGEISLQRDGLSCALAARIGVVALDEGGEDEAPPAALVERLAYWVDLDEVGRRDVEPAMFSPDELERARAMLPQVEAEEPAIPTLTAIAAALGVDSLRAPLFALRAARALCALRGALETEAEDIELAAALVLGPRATRAPAAQEPEDGAAAPEEQTSEGQSPRELEARVLEAARAAVPPRLLASLAARAAAHTRAASEGRAGAETVSKRRGRPLDARPGALAQGPPCAAADVSRRGALETAARPGGFKRARHRAARGCSHPAPSPAPRRDDDLRCRRFRFARHAPARRGQGRRRTAACRLLRAARSRRADRLSRRGRRGRAAADALHGARAAGADGSSRRRRHANRRRPRSRPGRRRRSRRKGQTPLIVLMTDGRANIGRNGAPGRPQAMSDALDAARRIGADKIAALAIDTAPASARGEAPARALAEAMNGAYVKLPLADAACVKAAVRGARPG